MEYEGGWFKVWRKLFKNPIFQNNDPYLFKTFMYCLYRANHKETSILFNGKEIVLMPGEFITGRFEASKDLRFKSKMWDRKIKVLENMQIVTKEVTNQFSKISVINWNTYQGSFVDDDQVSDHRMTNRGPTEDQPRTIDKNVKNVKNENTLSENFDKFWQIYPLRDGRRVTKKESFQYFKDNFKDEETFRLLIKATLNYSNSPKARDNYAKDPVRFLKKDFWKDWIEKPINPKDEYEIIGGKNG